MGQSRQFGLAPSPSRATPVTRRQPEPEEVFFAWLMWLPTDADRRKAAEREICRIDASAAEGEGPARLRALFADLVAG